MRATWRGGLLAFGVSVVLCAIAISAFGVMSQPILIDDMGRRIGVSELAHLTAIDGEPVSREILRAGPKGFTLEAERNWWQTRKRLAETLQKDQTVTLSLEGENVVATVSRSAAPGLKSDLGIVLGAALLFVFGCVVIAKRHPSPAGMALALHLMPGTFVMLAAGVFELVQIALPYWVHRTLFALTAFGNVGVAAGLHFALIFPRPHPRWRIGKRGLWFLHAVVIGHCMLVASGVLAYTTLVPVSAALALGMTVLLLEQFREEHNGSLKVHLLLLASPLPVACILLFIFYAFAPDLGVPRIDGSYLALSFLIALVVYAAVFENATFQQQRIAEQVSLREELHDELLSRLANISLMSEVALQSQSDRESLATRLSTIQGEARANAAYARELLRISGDSGWDDFCAQMLETGIALTRDHAVQFTLVSSRQEGGRLPPAPMRVCLYKMLREAIHNTLKHARASSIDVELSLRGDIVDFRYCDNGTGFDEHSLHSDQYGLGMLRRRAQELGAALHIDSSAESGTTLAFSGPVA